MPLPPDFAGECLYSEDAWFLHDLIELDEEKGIVVASLDTTKIGAMVDAQQPWPGHEKHLPGAVAIQMTGTLGNLHAVYCLGLRPSQGWVGYGVTVNKARFHRLAHIGPPVEARCEATRVRRLAGQVFVSYTFTFSQNGEPVYESQQMATWFNATETGPDT